MNFRFLVFLVIEGYGICVGGVRDEGKVGSVDYIGYLIYYWVFRLCFESGGKLLEFLSRSDLVNFVMKIVFW